MPLSLHPRGAVTGTAGVLMAVDMHRCQGLPSHDPHPTGAEGFLGISKMAQLVMGGGGTQSQSCAKCPAPHASWVLLALSGKGSHV